MKMQTFAALALAGLCGTAQAADCTDDCPFQLTRYIAVTDWKEDAAAQRKDYGDLYTSVIIASDPMTANVIKREYADEERTIFERFFVGKTTVTTANLYISVSNPDFNATIPLVTVSHTSSTDVGEVFATDLVQSNYHTPLFRIGAMTVANFRLEAKISRQIQSQAVGTTIKAITDAISIAAPSSALLTTLSKPETERTAHAVDSTVSTLLADAKTESLSFDHHMDRWTADTRTTIQAFVPEVHRVKIDQGEPQKVDFTAAVGAWNVRMTCPRPSAFYSLTICDKLDGVTTDNQHDKIVAIQKLVNSYVPDTQVLQFHLSSQVSIADFVQTQPWYTSFVRNSAANKSAATKDQQDFFKQFCSDATESLTANGLNQFDAGMVIKSMAYSMSAVNSYQSQIFDNCLRQAPFALYNLAPLEQKT